MVQDRPLDNFLSLIGPGKKIQRTPLQVFEALFNIKVSYKTSDFFFSFLKKAN